jgi:HAD superfamily hydrolase (TIGR01490 family)
MTDLAIYDMDRTITRRGTYTPFLIHCAVRHAPLRLLFAPVVLLSMIAYVLKIISRGKLKEINHALLLGRSIHPRDLMPLVNEFANKTIAHDIRPGALKAIARDKAEGRRVVMATASYRLYAATIAERLGFDDTIGTNSVIGLDENVRAKIDGENCYGAAKLRMIVRWLENESLTRAHVRFYSDHASDLPVFDWSDDPVAVNPHDKLLRLARLRGWRIEDWG